MTIAPRGYDAVPAGASLVAVALGDADAPAVLMLHGEGQSRAMWAEAVTALAEAGRYVIALDLRGHGESRAAS